MLDVACGTGNVALPAARAGARVTGLGNKIVAIFDERTEATDGTLQLPQEYLLSVIRL